MDKNTKIWIINFFQTSRGENPILEFIENQDKPTQTKITHAIDLLEKGGPFLKPPYMKKLQSGLYELRISGKIPIRIFYTMQNGEYHLLHAFKKKSQKTPSKELKIALDRLKELI